MAPALSFFANLVVLLVGALVCALVYENVAGNESFSLPFVNILLVVLIGGALFWWYGWRSTCIVLAAYGAFCVVGGLVDR